MAKQKRRNSPAEQSDSGTLYVVATPIGNLADLSPRARECLGSVTLVASESLTATRRLLSALQISCPRLVSYREENSQQVQSQILEHLQGGGSAALVSEAGTPAVSDPGWQLVRACREQAIPVRAIAGPSALVAALSVSGLDTRVCRFAGFPPHQRKARREFLQSNLASREALIIFESPHRVADTVDDLIELLGLAQEAVVLRELTKIFEENRCGPLSQFQESFKHEPPRGEFVVLIPARPEPASDHQEALVLQRKIGFLNQAGMSHRDIVDFLTQVEGYPRNQVYNLATAARSEGPD